MPELLLNANDLPRLSRGSIIAIRPDGWKWGTEERTNRFFRITVTGVTVEQLEQYLEVLYDGNDEVTHERRWHIQATLANQIQSNGGSITIAVAGLQSALVDQQV